MAYPSDRVYYKDHSFIYFFSPKPETPFHREQNIKGKGS